MAEKESWPDVMGRFVLKRNKQDVQILNFKTQEDVILAMENGYAQAGALDPQAHQGAAGQRHARSLVPVARYAWVYFNGRQQFER